MENPEQLYNPKTKEFLRKHKDHADYIDEKGNRIRIYGKGKISKINHEKLKNLETCRIKIPIKKGVPFFIKKLKIVNLYTKELEEKLKNNGIIFSEIKKGFIAINFEDSLYEKEKENHLIPNTDTPLIKMLKKELRNGATFIALNPREKSFFKLSNKKADEISIKKILKKAHCLNPGFIGLVFKNHQTDMKFIQKIIISAYDGEGYLIWERKKPRKISTAPKP